MNFRHAVRLLTNRLVHFLPRGVLIHLLKSLSAEPALQRKLHFHITPFGFYSPIPNPHELDVRRLEDARHLPGVHFDLGAILSLLDHLQPYTEELARQPDQATPEAEYWFRNGNYEDFDAITLYGMVRHAKPQRLIEVGSGFSSRVISLAARQNALEGRPVHCTFVEPYPSPELQAYALPGELLVEKIECVPLSRFQELKPGDILFIDTSHVVKAQNDCCYELLQVLPALPPGVLVHIHDIFTPFDYPAEWLLSNYYFNEQYALECLLTHNPKLKVILPVHWLSRTQPGRMARLFPRAVARPAAIWLETA